MDKTDNNSLTNQPETGVISSSISSRVVGCWGVVEEVCLMSNSRPRWTNRRYAILTFVAPPAEIGRKLEVPPHFRRNG